MELDKAKSIQKAKWPNEAIPTLRVNEVNHKLEEKADKKLVLLCTEYAASLLWTPET